MKVLLSFALLFFLLACSSDEKMQDDFAFEKFKEGESIVLENVHGGSKNIVRTKNGFLVEGEEDKVLIFDFFGTFCPPCKEEAPFLTDLWKQNSENLVLIGLDHFEEVSDDEIRKFAHEFGAYYFLSNSPNNKRLIAQILHDIDYANMEQLPFKVMLYKGEYQIRKSSNEKYYLGLVPISVINSDLHEVLNTGVK